MARGPSRDPPRAPSRDAPQRGRRGKGLEWAQRPKEAPKPRGRPSASPAPRGRALHASPSPAPAAARRTPVAEAAHSPPPASPPAASPAATSTGPRHRKKAATPAEAPVEAAAGPHSAAEPAAHAEHSAISGPEWEVAVLLGVALILLALPHVRTGLPNLLFFLSLKPSPYPPEASPQRIRPFPARAPSCPLQGRPPPHHGCSPLRRTG